MLMVPVLAGLIAEMGDDRNRFPDAAVLLAEAGLAPVTKASRRTRQVRFRYAANRRMRHVIDWAVFVASREDPWSRTVYDNGRARGQGEYRALRGLGDRWTLIFVALLDRLLDRPHHLRPGLPPTTGAERRLIPHGSGTAAHRQHRSRGPGWPQAT